MNRLPRLLTRPIFLKNNLSVSPLNQITVRNAGYWNKDWCPGPYPKTEEERRAAAKKYNLLPEDYEPYPDDGTGYGDYPKLPVVSAESKDQHLNWEFDELKRNYGEPVHVDADMYGEDRWDASKRMLFPIKTQVACLVGVLTVFGLLFLWGEEHKVCFVRVMPKHIYDSGKTKHYTFELKKDC